MTFRTEIVDTDPYRSDTHSSQSFLNLCCIRLANNSCNRIQMSIQKLHCRSPLDRQPVPCPPYSSNRPRMLCTHSSQSFLTLCCMRLASNTCNQIQMSIQKLHCKSPLDRQPVPCPPYSSNRSRRLCRIGRRNWRRPFSRRSRQRKRSCKLYRWSLPWYRNGTDQVRM